MTAFPVISRAPFELDVGGIFLIVIWRSLFVGTVSRAVLEVFWQGGLPLEG